MGIQRLLTATIFLIRHAAHAHLGQVLSGRMPGIALSADGARQAERLATSLSSARFAAVHTSPVQRARETAAAIVFARNVRPVVSEALDEIDFGGWTGKTFAELDGDDGWRRWNDARGSAVATDGESMAAARGRIVAHIDKIAQAFAGSAVAFVTHCDLIRAAVAHYLALPLDCLLNFDIDPASVSRLAVGDWGGRVLSVNETADGVGR